MKKIGLGLALAAAVAAWLFFRRPSPMDPPASLSSAAKEPYKPSTDCLRDRVEVKLDRDFLVGKEFQNACMSGEWGKFMADGSLPTNWGLDYAGPEDDRPSSGTARWSLEGDKLTISNSAITNGTYEDWRAFSFKGAVFVMPRDVGCDIFIGPDQKRIDDFFDNKFRREHCLN